MKLETNLLYKISFGYLFSSLFLFLGFWLNNFIAPLLVFVLGVVLFFIFKDKNAEDNSSIDIKFDYIVIAAVAALVWCLWGGIGGYFWQQMPDWPFRNATIRDLTEYYWPVYYSSKISLVYYFGFYLVPVFVGKFVSIALSFTDVQTISIVNFMLLMWSALGVFLIFLNLFLITKSNDIKSIIVLFIFILFAGMDLFIGDRPHMDWHPPFSYLSNTLQLFYSCHIAIPIWLASVLLYQKMKRIDYYGILSVMFLFYCPQTFLCAAVYMIYFMFRQFFIDIKNKNLKQFFKNIFDIKNVLSVFIILPVLYLFFKSNYASSHYNFYFNKPCLLAFQCIVFGAGIYLVLLATRFYKNSLIYLSGFVLAVFPFIAFKTDYDFLLRAPIPAIIIMIILIIKFLFLEDKYIKVYKYLLITALMIGTLSPLNIIMSSYDCWNRMYDLLLKDYIITFNGKITPEDKMTDNIYDYRNYASINYNEYFFWKYIARPKRK